MSDRDPDAPRIIPPERAAKVEHVRHVIAVHRHPVDWRVIAEGLARALRVVADCEDHAGNCCAEWCSACRDAARGRSEGTAALAAFDEALRRTP